MPIPDHPAFDDETRARSPSPWRRSTTTRSRRCKARRADSPANPSRISREIREYRTFVVRAHRREWEAVLGDATGWRPFQGNRRLVERKLLAHSRRCITGQLEGSSYGLPGTGAFFTLLRSERPDRDNDLAWLLAPDDSRNPPRETIGELPGRLTHATGAAGRRA